MTLLPLLLLALLSGEALSCDCDDCCWQKCFSSPGIYSAEYARLHSMVTTLIAQKETLGTGGTAFTFDYTTSTPFICEYQKNLASLIALTMPVEDVCNPFFLNRNAHNHAGYSSSWQCKNKCQAPTTISNFGHCKPPSNPQPISNWINGGCWAAYLTFNSPWLSCSKNVVKKREMVISLANSPFHLPLDFSWCSGYTRAVVGVENANIPQMDAFASNPLLSFDFTQDMSGPTISMEPQNALKQLLKCIKKNCCGGSENTPVKRQAQMANFTILLKDSDIPLTMTEEEAEQFIQDIIDNPPKPTTSAPNPCKPNKRCTKKGGQCYTTPPAKNCKSIGKCSKKGGCKCYKCKK